MERDEFKKYFSDLFDKLGINDQKVEGNKKKLEESKKSETRNSFILLCVIAVAVSYFISLKFQ